MNGLRRVALSAGLMLGAFALGPLAFPAPTPVNDTLRGDPPPPAWVAQFAQDFCDMNTEGLLSRFGGDLAYVTSDQIARRRQNWHCEGVLRYLGFGEMEGGRMEYYFRLALDGHKPTYGFVTEGSRVVGIE